MNMDVIRQLLDKYYNGETNSNEEKILQDFFSKDDVPAEFVIDRDLFKHMASVKKGVSAGIPDDMKKRLSEKIDTWEKQEFRRKTVIRSFYKYTAGIVASVLLAVGIGLSVLSSSSKGMEDTFDNPQEAYMATEDALRLFAEVLDKGNTQMDKAKKATREMKEKIENIKDFKK